MSYKLSLFDKLINERHFEKEYSTQCLLKKMKALEKRNYLMLHLVFQIKAETLTIADCQESKKWSFDKKNKQQNYTDTIATAFPENHYHELILQTVKQSFGYQPINCKHIVAFDTPQKDKLIAEVHYYQFDFSSILPQEYQMLYFEKLLKQEKQKVFTDLVDMLPTFSSPHLASDFIAAHLTHLDHIIKKASIRQQALRSIGLKTDQDMLSDRLYDLLKRTAEQLSKKLLVSFSNSPTICLSKRTRIQSDYKGFYAPEEVTEIEKIIPSIESVIKSPSLQQLLKAPILQFIKLSSLLLKKHDQLHIDVYYELSQHIDTFINLNKKSRDFERKVAKVLLPDLIKSNFDPSLIFEQTYEYYKEKTTGFQRSQKSDYLKNVKRELQRQQLIEDTFSPYHHHPNKPSALQLLLKNCQQEIEYLNHMPQYTSTSTSSEVWEKPHPIPFLAKRKDVTIFLLALREIGFILPDLKYYKLAHCIESSSVYNSNMPMKNIESLFSKIRSGEIRPSPSLIETSIALVDFLKNTPPGSN